MGLTLPVLLCWSIFSCMQAFNIETGRKLTRTIRKSNTDNQNYFFGYNVLIQNLDDNLRFIIGAPTQENNDVKLNQTQHGSLYSYQRDYTNTSQDYDDIHMNLTNQVMVTTHAGPFDILKREGLTMSTALHKGNTIASNQITVCAPLQMRDCLVSYHAVGACYISTTDNFKGNWRKLSPCDRGCGNKKVDLMFVVDGSNSVTNASFIKVLDWIKDVVDGFNILDAVHVGVVQYSSASKRRTYIKTEVGLGQYKNKQKFDLAIDRIKYAKGSTYTASAIIKTVNEDFKGNMSRYPEARRVMILLTDGKSTDVEYLPSATNYARESGVESFAVGVGNEFIKSELDLIAGSPDRVKTVENFDGLASIVGQIQNDIQILDGGNSSVNNELHQCEIGLSTTFAQVYITSIT